VTVTPYRLEGVVTTDRVIARVRSDDGEILLAESPDIYVSDTNNTKQGRIGAIVRGGRAEFWNWVRE